MRAIIAVLLAVGLFLLNVVLLRLNRKTPVPEGCENLKPDCNACGITDCSMKGQWKGNNENGNH